MGGLHNFCPEEMLFSLDTLCFLHAIPYDSCKFPVILALWQASECFWWQEFGLENMPQRCCHFTIWITSP